MAMPAARAGRATPRAGARLGHSATIDYRKRRELMRARWSDNDHYWGPFTYAKHSRGYRPLALALTSDKGEDDDYDWRGNTLRLSAFGHTLIAALPRMIRPKRSWHVIKTEPTRSQMIAQGREPGYWECWRREYSISLAEGAMHLRFGEQTHDSTTDKSKCYFLPWKQWRFVGHRLYGLDGSLFAKLPHRAKFQTPEYAEGNRLKDACPTAAFAFDDFDGERITATTKIEEREWAFGERKFKWLSLFRRNKVSRSLDLRFSAETGKRKGSWKGGTVGHSIDMRPGELHEAAFRRYCAEHAMTFVGAVTEPVPA